MPSLPAPPSDYKSRFDPTKNFKRWLFRPARGLQSPELNELEDTRNWEFATAMNATYGDGAMLSGGIISQDVPNTTTQATAWDAQAGTFYAQGFLYEMPAWTFTIQQPTTVGGTDGETVAVGIILHVDVVDETLDATLLDPCPGTKNFGEAGAARMRYTATWGKQTAAGANDWFYHRLDFTNGQPTGGNDTDAVPSDIMQAIARYDRNANGNYIVRGHKVSYLSDDLVNQAHVIQLSEGQTNVFGWEQVTLTALNYEVGFALDTAQVYAEPITFTTNGEYQLRHGPVASVGPQVNGIIQTTQAIVHGAYEGAIDQLPNTPVVSISLVTQATTTFVQGTDYAQTGDRITWLTGGNQPSPGSTYTVTWMYSAVFTPTIGADKTGINVTGLAPNTIFYVDYTYYIPRYDLLVIDQNLSLTIVRGQPAPQPSPPQITSGLALATIYVSYGNAPIITNSDLRRPLTSDLVNMQESIQDIRYNLARLSLTQQLTTTDPVSLMKGIFVDPFTDDNMRDAGLSQNAEIAAGILYMDVPWTWLQVTNTNAFTANNKTYLPYTEVVLSQNLDYSTTFQINAYTGLTPPPADIQTWPPELCWCDGAVTKAVTADPAYIPYWAIGGVPQGIPYPGPPGSPWNVQGGYAVTSTQVTQEMITTPVPVPPTVIYFSGQLFNAGETVKILCDNQQVSTTTAQSNGWINGQFTTPTGMLSGTKLIEFIGSVSGVAGVSSFTAVPFKQVTTEYVAKIIYYDPLAETFTPPNDAYVTSIDAYITRDSTKGSSHGSFIDCLLLDTQVGLPDRANTLTSTRNMDGYVNDASRSQGLTKFTFTNPHPVSGAAQYAFALATPSPVYYAWGSTLGQYDWNHYRWISAKPTTGTMLESSNSSTWLPMLQDDLTYTVWAAKFAPTRTVTYPSVTLTNVTDVMLMVAQDLPTGTKIQWSMTLTVGGKSVIYALTPGSPVSIPLYTGPAVLTAVMSTTNSWVSPVIDPVVSLAYAEVVNPSTYITRAIPVAQNAQAAATTLKVYLEIYEPDPNTVLVEYLAADGVTWTAFTRDNLHAVNVGFSVVDMPFTASATAMVGASQTRIRITLSSIDTTFVRRPYARNLRMYFS